MALNGRILTWSYHPRGYLEACVVGGVALRGLPSSIRLVGR